METPLVSVIIPVYNAEFTIINCLDSVLNQTYANISIVIIDDGSTDRTVELVESYIKANHLANISVFSQNNAGPSCARNLGINKAQGEYIAFLDADDLWKKDKLAKQVNILEKNPEFILACTLSMDVRENEPFRIVSFCDMLYSNLFTTSATICRKFLFEKNRFNVSQRYSEDYRLWLQLLKQFGNGVIINEYLTVQSSKARFGESGLSARLWQMEKGELSNYLYLYKSGFIPSYVLANITVYSFLKFLRRTIITCYNNIRK